MVNVVFFGSKQYVKDMFNSCNNSYNYNVKFYEANISEDNVKLVKGAEVVCLFVNDIVDRKMLELLKHYGCKLIALRCAGFNNIDIDAAKELGIAVVRVPEYSPYAVAEHAACLLLTLNRKTHKAYNRVREGNFALDGLLGQDLYKKTIGVIGTGKIGKVFINIMAGFGMKILAYDPFPDMDFAKQANYQYVDLDEIYKQSDVIALHCPLTKDNYHMINKDSIAKMKDGVILINTSRGGLVNAKDIIFALKNNKLGAVGFDVYEEESAYFFEDLSSKSHIEDEVLARLLTFHNVIITAHQAFFTKEALNNIAETTLSNIEAFMKHNKLVNSCIN